MHALAEVQDTPKRLLYLGEPAGVAVCWMVQTVPFHPSDSVLVAEYPTAVQALVEQDTLSRVLLPPGGLGVCWIVHEAPFQASANVAEKIELVW